MNIKAVILSIYLIFLTSCITQAEKFSRMSPEEVASMTNEELCINADISKIRSSFKIEDTKRIVSYIQTMEIPRKVYVKLKSKLLISEP